MHVDKQDVDDDDDDDDDDDEEDDEDNTCLLEEDDEESDSALSFMFGVQHANLNTCESKMGVPRTRINAYQLRRTSDLVL